jgi:diacylglycerol kinase family enzyme
MLVVNPAATATSPRTREVLTAALDSDLKLDVAHTERRGHAAELARQARHDGLDIVVVLGGDGTVNEVVNGLLADGRRGSIPQLAVVPGGGTNVFTRSLGLPRDPVEATAVVLDALREGRRRWIGLGRADDRWFTFCAGLGLDAEVVRAMDQRRAKGRGATPGAYVRTAVRQFFAGTDRRHPALTVEPAGHAAQEGVFLAIIANTSPWTYLGERPVQPSPEASFDDGLDLYALRRLRTLATLRQAAQLLGRQRAGLPKGRQVVQAHDVGGITVRASRPVAAQVDGEPMGEVTEVVFRSEPAALQIVL